MLRGAGLSFDVGGAKRIIYTSSGTLSLALTALVSHDYQYSINFSLLNHFVNNTVVVLHTFLFHFPRMLRPALHVAQLLTITLKLSYNSQQPSWGNVMVR